MEEASSSSEVRDEGALELENVVSDLHALKKLYGLLQQSNVNAKIPKGENSKDSLDEKSRLMLKKLLDGATQQALQCQAKIVSCTLEPTTASEKSGLERRSKMSSEAPQKCTQRVIELRKCHLDVQDENTESAAARSTQTDKPREEPATHPVAEPTIERKPCPDHERSDLKRQRSEKPVGIPDPGLKSDLRIHHERHPAGGERSSRKMNTRTPRSQPDRGPSTLPGLHHGLTTSGAVIPPVNQKRSRVESSVPNRTRAVSRANEKSTRQELNRTRAIKRADKHLTQQKPSRPAEKQAVSRHMENGGSKRTGLPDRTVDNQLKDGPRAARKDNIGHSGRRGLTIVEKSTSHRRDLSLSQLHSSQTQPSPLQPPRQLPPKTPIRMRSIRNSSPSESNTSSSQETSSSTRSDATSTWTRRDPGRALPRRMTSHLALAPGRLVRPRDCEPTCRIPRRRNTTDDKRPRRMVSHHGEVGRPRTSASNASGDHQKKRQAEGKLRRFKNKLAIIFHHHHHHHHHLHPGGEHHHSSPWEYLRRILHHRSKEAVNGKRVAPPQHQHGYLHALLDGLLRHVWGTRQRRVAKAEKRRLGKAGIRVGAKKLHWWQWFRRRRGVRLAKRKKPRLRIAFGKARLQATKNNKN